MSPRKRGAARWLQTLLHEPGRGLLLLAAILLVVGALLPWAIGFNAGGDPLAVRPTEGLGEGVYMLLVGLTMLALGVGRLIVETTNRLLQLVPAALTIVAAAMWLNADNLSRRAIETWEIGGGSGEQTLAPWIALGGTAAAALATVLLELRRPADVRAQTPSLGRELGINGRALLGAVVTGLLGLLGGALALGATVAVFGIRGILPAIAMGIFGLLAGLAIGGRVARRLNAAG